MPRDWCLAAVAAAALSCLALVGCDGGTDAGSSSRARPFAIGSATIHAEIADEPEERERGLMYRKELGPDNGMLFVFEEDGPLSFWMRNTLVPLSIAYIAADGTILEIHDMHPLDERAVPSRTSSARYALEVNQGWFAVKGIAPGAKLDLSALAGTGR